MGLFQQAIKTYDSMEKMGLVGKYEEGKEPLAPIGHNTIRAGIVISINMNGEFIDAEKVNMNIIIPVSELSSGRTSTSAINHPHPISDKLKYIINDIYLENLIEWEKSEYKDDKLIAIIKYLKRCSVIDDLKNRGLITYDSNKNLKNIDDVVTWRIYGYGNSSVNLFEDKEIMNKYQLFYIDKKSHQEKELCYVTGESDYSTTKHLMGVVSKKKTAKIISSNDKDNFTYKGRFIDEKEALSVGYIASQKAHNVLKWLVSTQGIPMGERILVCWNPEGKKIPQPHSPLIRRSKEETYKPSDYKEKLRSILLSYKKNIGGFDEAVIVSFDASTKGRLSVSYYNEMKCSDFLERIEYWDNTCCWYDNNYGTYSPGLYDIVDVAFGFQRGEEDNSRIETDPKVVSQHLQRLIKCRIDKTNIPRDILNAIISKTANLQIYNAHNRRKVLFTACAVIRKYYIDSRKEIWEMALDKDKKDRSYQFGRLLAVFEKIERDVYSVSGEKRETNAIRMQSVYVKRPAYASKILIEQLKNSYYPKLSVGSRTYYDKLIGQIMSVISEFGDEKFNKPLSETYLLGYYLQRNDLYTKKEETEDSKDE